MTNMLKEYEKYFEYLLRKKEIINNPEYFLWLQKNSVKGRIEYIQKKQNFDKLELLEDLFNEIDEYAKKNNLPSQENGLEFAYFINYNNNIYKIGVIYDIHSTYYFERVEESLDYINFEDIINNLKSDDETYINQTTRLINDINVGEDIKKTRKKGN